MGPLLQQTRPTPVLTESLSNAMPHICGPHSQLPNCRYHDQRRQQQQQEPTTTWVPIPIHKVQEVTEESAGSNFNRNASLPYQVQQPERSSSTSGVSRTVPIQLASPNLIMSASKQQPPAKDELFPRKKKSGFTM